MSNNSKQTIVFLISVGYFLIMRNVGAYHRLSLLQYMYLCFVQDLESYALSLGHRHLTPLFYNRKFHDKIEYTSLVLRIPSNLSYCLHKP